MPTARISIESLVVKMIINYTHTVVSCPKPSCHADSLYGSVGYDLTGVLSPCLYSCTFHYVVLLAHANHKKLSYSLETWRQLCISL